MFPFLVAIVTHTPTPVWILLAVLVALGLRQTAPRRIGVKMRTVRMFAMLTAALAAVTLSWMLATADTAVAEQPVPAATPWAARPPARRAPRARTSTCGPRTASPSGTRARRGRGTGP